MDNQELLTKITDLIEGKTSSDAEVSPEVLSALYGMAYQFYRNGKYEEAKKFFKFLTIFNTFDRRCWMGLAACHHMQKEYAEAIECYSVAAIQDPNDPYAHWHAAECFYSLNKLSEALEAVDSALTVAKKDTSHQSLVSQLEFIQQTWNDKVKGENL